MKRNYLPTETLPSWAKLNGISVDGINFRKLRTEDGIDKGCAIVATEDRSNEQLSGTEEANTEVLLRVPSDMVLSLQMVENHAKSDRYLREVLDAVGDFGRTARGAILIFLILQITYSTPDFANEHHRIGLSNPWTEYVQYMPSSILLPTFYTSEERELLRGTSLKMAVDAKMASLEKEFEHFAESTEEIGWCQKHWWDEETGKLTFHDWKYIDAVYRSRMVDLPRCGHAMVPCIDMANHAPEDTVKALYEEDTEGNAVLQLRPGRGLHKDEEVTISYGADKPASEMIFSYGFLEQERGSAKEILLDLEIPDDDPLKVAKNLFCKSAPGIRLSDAPGAETDSTIWDSPLVWWICVNEEDGLDFEVLQTNDGDRELKATWRGEELKHPGDLNPLLSKDDRWEIFQLRAVVTILDRLESQYYVLRETQIMVGEIKESEDMLALFKSDVFRMINSLRELEGKLLEKGIEYLVQQRQNLITSDAVLAYLNQQQSDDVEEDFS
ncbi:SET domain-containing protein [Aspergillus avenaceus]|uniref:SET domain-containing protein n=1 Tax=Aspergillus avenaceus TaxID=36643 RepID=A0A5N6U621_ASPAV|nr:SET domain-containing protein [Aspergillus avenaceus]